MIVVVIVVLVVLLMSMLLLLLFVGCCCYCSKTNHVCCSFVDAVSKLGRYGLAARCCCLFFVAIDVFAYSFMLFPIVVCCLLFVVCCLLFVV